MHLTLAGYRRSSQSTIVQTIADEIMSSFLPGKIGLVTGGASGIGFSYVRHLLKNSMKGVTIADVDPKKGEETLRAIEKEFGRGRAIFAKTDVTIQEDVEAAFEKTIGAFKNVDLVVNSAGIFNDKRWEACVAINLVGTIRTCLLAIERYFPEHRSGSEAVVVNVSSICGLKEFGSLPMYTATKHGVVGFSRSLGVKEHYARTGVRILTVCPGITETPLVAGYDEQFFSAPYCALSQKDLRVRPTQTTEVVAEALIHIIQVGETGSVWVVEGDRTYQAKFSEVLEPPV